MIKEAQQHFVYISNWNNSKIRSTGLVISTLYCYGDEIGQAKADGI
jgi:hypothetical protein